MKLPESVWDSAMTLDAFIDQASVHRDLWQSTRRLARISEELQATAAALSSTYRILVLLEDWCGDAIHTVPIVARVVESNPQLGLRVVLRDQQEVLMNAHLTGASRSIPVVIAYDADGTELGWWGPRPSALQQWVVTEGMTMDADERYKAIRTWYARDRGVSTANEFLQLLIGAP